MLASADTYVVVVALPAIMGGTGLSLDQLQRATPIVTGFLLGYVALLPLLGRLSDVHGRRPVFVGCLLAFACGSLVTATAHSAAVVIAGRSLQGAGGGGLVPVTLALVGEMWDPDERGVPLGAVGAVQELGSVLGPLYGAAIVAAAGWRAIFWINIPVAALLAVAFAPPRRRHREGRPDVVGWVLAGASLAGVVVALWAPPALANSVTFGTLYSPLAGSPTWTNFTTPLAFASAGLLVSFVAWEAWAPLGVRPVVAMRRTGRVLAGADAPGALLVAGVLTCIVVVFSTSDPARSVLASSAPVVLPLGAAMAAGLVWHERRSPQPLIPRAVLGQRATWGSMLVNLAVGAALMATLVDVPFFARATVDPNSQVAAAVVLVRFLLAVPVGALVGGWASRHLGNPVTAAVGMAASAGAFIPMTAWGPRALSGAAATAELVVCGFGFGLAIAPVNAAVLGAVKARWHGLASALAVVARMVGMLVGLSVLTAIGLRTFYREQARLGSPVTLCPSHPTNCPAYDAGAQHAVIAELHTVFGGASVAAGVAALLALVTLGGLRGPRGPAPAAPARSSGPPSRPPLPAWPRRRGARLGGRSGRRPGSGAGGGRAAGSGGSSATGGR
jgi:MFS family permease